MSVIDKLMNTLHLNDDDDDYDDDFYDDDEVVEKVKPEKEFRAKPEPFKEKAPAVKATPNVTPFQKNRKQVGGMEVCLIKPSNMEDAREITETLLNGRIVFLNMEGLDIEIAQRIIDFTSGACFAVSGNLQKVSNYIFIITPPNVDVSGDFQDMVDSFGLGSF